MTLCGTWCLSASFSHLALVAILPSLDYLPPPTLSQLLQTGVSPQLTAVWLSPLRGGGCGVSTPFVRLRNLWSQFAERCLLFIVNRY